MSRAQPSRFQGRHGWHDRGRLPKAVYAPLTLLKDVYVSTLADFVKAMGGRLEIRAIFPDGVVSISQFQEREGTPAEGRQPQVRTAELTRT